MPDEWIRQWGDPTLRMTAASIACIDEVLRGQVKRMRQRLVKADGAGLAATQVGLMRRLFVFRVEPDGDVDVLVNPEVVGRSRETAVFHEGCLSFNSVTVAVRRAVAVRVAGQDLDGRRRVLDAEGFAASLLQHEIDHLDGILTLDRAAPEERRRAMSELIADAA
jgi:peptide deformylase